MKHHRVIISRVEVIEGTVWLDDDEDPSQLTEDELFGSMSTVTEHSTGRWLLAYWEPIDADKAGAA